jgi:RNA polymerase sigma-54 factor
MSQFLAQLPRQVMRQEQRLTPQLIQAMDILQLPLMALEARIEQELDGNPALEVVSADDEASAAAESAESDRIPLESRPDTDESAAEFNRLDNLVREYGDDFDDDEVGHRRKASGLSEEGDAKLEAMQNTASRPVSVQEYLLDQWHLVETDERTRVLGELIINALDDHGRVSAPLAELAAEARPPATIAEMETALQGVQGLDPPGVGARSLQEALLIQLRALPEDTALEQQIIAGHFDDLQKNRLPQIARALGVELDDIKDAIQSIARLRLNPVSDFAEPPAPPIVPDVIVEYDADTDRYEVRLARDRSREIRISPEFRAELEQARTDRATRDFIRQKLESAGALLDALRFRRERLLEVAKAVVEAQRDFLDHGEQHLKVLRMSELAERFGCDPSTISRTVDEKYMQTPRGVFPLRRFFTGGTESGDGEVLGWDSIKAKVQEIVDAEDKSNPLNDDEIVDLLRAQGIEIKRRTVAKYRAQLNIAPARQRRRF